MRHADDEAPTDEARDSRLRARDGSVGDRFPLAYPASFQCADGYTLWGHHWTAIQRTSGLVIINPATGVLASYYHFYADFLCRRGFDVITYDYRGIGRSKPASLRGASIRWRDWGQLDFEAVLKHASVTAKGIPIIVVGHSIGGFLPGYAESARRITRMLTVGAQYAYWPDYARGERWKMLLKWHVAMPLTTFAYGYFPARRLGWHEDLPRGVAFEWAFRRRAFERNVPQQERDSILTRFERVTAPILAVGVTDDAFGTSRAIARGLSYYRRAPTTTVMLSPGDLGFPSIGHFGLFHARHASGFWVDTLLWLRNGRSPWMGEILRR